jgi:hypothetical protein
LGETSPGAGGEESSESDISADDFIDNDTGEDDRQKNRRYAEQQDEAVSPIKRFSEQQYVFVYF